MYKRILNLGDFPWKLRQLGTDAWHAASVPGLSLIHI